MNGKLKKMIKVKLTTNYPDWPIIRQTPLEKGVWGDYLFFINQDIKECDWWIVFDGLLNKEKTLCPKENTIFITGEPPDVKKYDSNFLKQFKTIVSCERNDLKHPNIINNQQGLPWMIGANMAKETNSNKKFTKNYDELKQTETVKKNKIISAIVSSKNFTDGHKKRLDFINKAKNHFKEKLDVFGFGQNPIPDKWDAIAPYKYHIALENSSVNDYWTEKLSDSFLSLSLPIYHGCPNIIKYFPDMPLMSIDISNINESIQKIEGIISNNLYEKEIDKIKEAKRLILDKYNFFANIAYFCDKNNTATKKKEEITLEPEKIKKSILKRIIRKIIY